MSVQENKEILRRVFNIFNSRDLSSLEEVCDKNLVYRSTAGEEYKGIDAFKEAFSQGYEAFSDMEMSLEELAGEGDKVFCIYRWTGTQDGEFLGIAPRNKKIDLLSCSVCTCKNGKVTEVYDFYDALTMLKQLGAVSEEVRPGGAQWPTGQATLQLRG